MGYRGGMEFRRILKLSGELAFFPHVYQTIDFLSNVDFIVTKIGNLPGLSFSPIVWVLLTIAGAGMFGAINLPSLKKIIVNLDLPNSQVSLNQSHWKSAEADRVELIRRASIEIALKLRFRSLEAHRSILDDFNLSLHRSRFFPQRNVIPAEISYAMRSLSRPTEKLPIEVSVPAGDDSDEIYLFGFVIVSGAVGALITRRKTPVLILSFRINNDAIRRFKVDVDWDTVWRQGSRRHTVLRYSEII
jgi:hypothetical protein